MDIVTILLFIMAAPFFSGIALGISHELHRSRTPHKRRVLN